MSTVDPEVLYESMTKATTNKRKAAGLGIIHGICRERFDAKATDWGISSIGRESKKRGGPGAPSLHQPRLEHYRGLIKAWQAHAEASHPAAKKKVSAEQDDWIEAIENVAARQLVYALKSELQRTKAKLRLVTEVLPGKGLIEVRMPGASASVQGSAQVTRSIGIPAPVLRETRQLFEGPLENESQLKEMGLHLSRGDLVSLETGELLIGKAVLDHLRAVSKLT